MRNVYTVMAYERPGATGNNNTVQFGTYPTLGLLGLTNATQAMEEFTQVRVLKQPLSSGSTQQSASSQGGGSPLSVGVKFLIGLAGFSALCFALFALRYLWARRGPYPPGRVKEGSDQELEYGAYQSTGRKSRSSIDDEYGPEFSMRKSKLGDSFAPLETCDSWDPHTGTLHDTIIGTEAGEAASPYSSYFPPPELADPDLGSPELTSALLMAHDRCDSQTSDLVEFGMHDIGMVGIGTAARGSVIDPVLQHDRASYDSVKSSTPLRRTGISSLRSSHTLASLRGSVSVPCDADRTF